MLSADWTLVWALALAGAVVLGALAWAWLGLVRQRRMLGALYGRLELLQQLRDESGARVAAVEHEMRTPLSVILGWSSILSEASASPQDRKTAIECIVRSARLLQHQVDSLLEVERSRREIAESSMREINLGASVAGLCAEFEPLLGGRSLRMDLEPQCWAMADEEVLHSIVLHLLDNAAKYAAGDITVRVHSNGGVHEVSVEDDGPGIPPGVDLLGPFQRGCDAGVDGFGLGLHIVYEWAAAMRGTFTIANGHGGGAVALIRLPAAVLQ